MSDKRGNSVKAEEKTPLKPERCEGCGLMCGLRPCVFCEALGRTKKKLEGLAGRDLT